MRVFVTVGSMLPFDRLIRAMDDWAGAHPHASVFAQIGESTLRPAHIECSAFVSPPEFRHHFATCDIVVSHVGMGTVITAFECAKPIIMLPRRPELAEVTSNHQLATAKWLQGRPGIRIVHSEHELGPALERGRAAEGASRIETGTRARLVEALREFIAG